MSRNKKRTSDLEQEKPVLAEDTGRKSPKSENLSFVKHAYFHLPLPGDGSFYSPPYLAGEEICKTL
jgi:hypothetical protein